jgi:hypothetical protein
MIYNYCSNSSLRGKKLNCTSIAYLDVRDLTTLAMGCTFRLHLLGLGCSEATKPDDYKYMAKGILTTWLGIGWLWPP